MTQEQGINFEDLSREDFCYLITTGRVTGNPHEIEIWFGLEIDTVYLMAGNHESDWVKNLRKDPNVIVRIGSHDFKGTARLVTDMREDTTARYMLAQKYQEWEQGNTLSEWARSALVVGIRLEGLQA